MMAVSLGAGGFAIASDYPVSSLSSAQETSAIHPILASFITQKVWAHDGDGDGFDDDTLLPVIDEASNDPFPGSGEDFTSTLTRDAVVGHASNSTSAATATLLWSEDQERLQYEISFSGPIVLNQSAGSPSQEAVTKVHIHIGANGTNGSHALNIFGGPAEDDAEMRFDPDSKVIRGVWGDIDTGTLTNDVARSKQLSDMREELCAGDLYFQVHTNWNGPGALRGQIERASELCDFDLAADEFTATLNRLKVVATGVTSAQTGTATVELNLNDDHTQLYYRIEFTGIDLNGTTATPSDDLEKLHIHQGDAMTAHGPHALNIFGLPSEDDAQMDFDPDTGVITGVWDDTDAVLHGTDAGRSHKLTDMTQKLCEGNLYIQAHTHNAQNIRGQIELQNHDLCDFDPTHDDFVAALSSDQIYTTGGTAADTGSSATGTAHFRFDSHGDALQYEIHLVGLDTDDVQTIADPNGNLLTDDDLTAIHLHHAPAMKAGHVHLLNIFGPPAFDDDDFVNTPGNGTISGIWEDGDESFSPSEGGRTKKLSDSIDALCNSEVYINIHTERHPHGEIRGQIIPTDDNVMCDFDLPNPDLFVDLTQCKVDFAYGRADACEEEIGGHGHGTSDHHGEMSIVPSTDTSTGGHGHGTSDQHDEHGGSTPEPRGYTKLFFNDDKTRLHYAIDLDNLDMTGANRTGAGQTIDTTHDDLYKIHIHVGGNTETVPSPHAYNIMRPDGDADDRRINNGTGVVAGIWEVGDASDSQTNSDLTDWYDELCADGLYLNIHTPRGTPGALGIIRGQIEVADHSTVCDSPSLLGLALINPTTVMATFSNPVNTTSLNAGDFAAFDLNGTSISSVSGYTNPHGRGVVIMTLDSEVDPAFVSDGSMDIMDTLTSDIGMPFHAHANPVTIRNALSGVPLSITSDNHVLALTDDSDTDTITIHQDATKTLLDFSSLSTTNTMMPGRTAITFPNHIDVTSTSSGATTHVGFPSGLNVAGNSVTFDGVFELPVFDSSCSANRHLGIPQICITFGSSSGELTLSEPVKITLQGQSGTQGFFQSLGQPPTKITAQCSAEDTPEVDGAMISYGGSYEECFFDDGTDLIIWTSHATSFGSFVDSPRDSFVDSPRKHVSGGGGKTTSVIASNIVSYNVCDPTKDGIVRVLTFNNPRIDEIGLNVYTDDFTSFGVNVTDTVPASTYLDRITTDYVYTVFDAKVPNGVGKFFVTVFDKDDGRTSSASLIDTRNMKCADSIFPHAMKDSDAEILPIEPIDQDAFIAPVESLVVEYSDDSIEFTHNQATAENPLPEQDVKVLVRSSSEALVEEPVSEPSVEEPVSEPSVEEPVSEPSVEEPVSEPSVEEPTNNSWIDRILSWFGFS